MVHAKTHVFQILIAFMLCSVMFHCSKFKVEAEESEKYNYQISYKYERVNKSTGKINSEEYSYNFDSNNEVVGVLYSIDTYTDIVYYYYTGRSITNYYTPNVQFTCVSIDVNGNESTRTGSTTFGNIYNSSGFKEETNYIYYYSSLYNFKLFSSTEGALLYYQTGDTSSQLNKQGVIWSNAQYTPLLGLNDFTASIQDDTLDASWDGVFHPKGVTNQFENTHVRVEFGFCPKGQPASSVKVNKEWKDTYSFWDNAFSIPLADIDFPVDEETFPDGFALNWVKATPYYYAGDDVTGKLYVGRSSVVYFDENGEASQTVNQAPTDSFEEEEAEKSIWNSITNFFAGFFKNLTDSLYNLVVPDSDELMALFQEINDWFSDRLGFIWYPFDLAIQMVNAFAFGEANGVFTVPGLTLNMFDGVTLWNEFDVEIDQFGIFQYVRYFTSVLLVCGVVRMAIDKWDEWIGGHNL